MLLRISALFFTIVLTIGAAMQQAKQNEENLTKKESEKIFLPK